MRFFALYAAAANVVYQTAHLWVGFIADVLGQLKSALKSGMLEKGPRTRKRDGEC